MKSKTSLKSWVQCAFAPALAGMQTTAFADTPVSGLKFESGPADFLILLTGYVGITIVSLFGIAVLWQIIRGRIDLKLLVSETDGTASMSRFQFLLFTFIIGFGFILLTITSFKGTPGFPTVDPGVMALLGISGGTYALSKNIQKNNDKDLGEQAGRKQSKPGWSNP